MSTFLHKLKERLDKFKNKISYDLKGHPELEDFVISFNIIQKEYDEVIAAYQKKDQEVENLKQQLEFLRAQVKNSEKKVKDFEPLEKVARECIKIYKNIVYSERFLNKDLLAKAESATTLLELSLDNGVEKEKPKKLKIYA